MPTPKKIWDPMCSCGHRAKKHALNNRSKICSDPYCKEKNCGCEVFFPKHEPARASDWVVKK